jgi:nitronate monooxygenase
LALVPQVVDAVGVPVVAAGGIADGRGIAAAFALGPKIIEGLSTFDTGWRQSVLLPPFVSKPEITLVPDGWSAPEDPVLEERESSRATLEKWARK